MMRWWTLLIVLVGMLAPAPAAAQTPGVGSFSRIDLGPTGARCRTLAGAGAPEGVVNVAAPAPTCTIYTDVLTAKRYRKVGTGTTGWRLDTLTGAANEILYFSGTDAPTTDDQFLFDGLRFGIGATGPLSSYILNVTGSAGAELITTGGWTLGANWGESPDETFTHTPGSAASLTHTASGGIVAGRLYAWTLSMSDRTVGGVTVTIGGVEVEVISEDEDYGGTFEAVNTTGVVIVPSGAFDGTLDGITLVEAIGPMHVGNDDVEHALVVALNGYVGIGTNAPTDPLTIITSAGGQFLFTDNGRPEFIANDTTQEMVLATGLSGAPSGIVLVNEADGIGHQFLSRPTGWLISTYDDDELLEILNTTFEWAVCGDLGLSGEVLSAVAGGCPTWGVIEMTSTATTAVKKAPVYVQNNLSNTTAGQGVGFWMQVADTAANDPTSACNTANPAAGDFVAYYACLETTAARDAGTIGVSAGLFGANLVLTAQNGENITMVGIEVDIQNLMGTGSTVPAAFAAESTVGVGVVMAHTATPGDGSAGFATHINGGTNNQWKYGYEAAGVRNSSFYARRGTNAGNVDPTNVLFNDTLAANLIYTTGTGSHNYLLNSTNSLAAAGFDIFGANGSAAGRTTLAGVAPTHDMYEIGGASNAKFWRLSADGGTLNLQTVNDAYDTAGAVLSFPRSGNTPGSWYSATSAGFGTGATVSARVHSLATTEQLRLGYDVSNYASTTVGATGGVTYDAVGSGAAFTFSDAVTHSVAVTDAGATLRTGVISPTQLTGNTDNWNPTNLATANVIRANVDAARNITGIVAQTSGRWILLHNTTAFTITLVHDATSTAANRFYAPGAANFSLTQKMSVWIYYDGAAASGVGRWLIVS